VSLRLTAVVCGLLGLALMIPFEATITRILGVGFLVAFVVVGLFAVASPGFVDGDGGSGQQGEREGDGGAQQRDAPDQA
jgi:hypothetical protein